jgi:hypothetical protein
VKVDGAAPTHPAISSYATTYVDNDKTYLYTLSHDKIVFIKFFVVKIGFFTNETYKMKRNDALLL